MPVIQEIVEAQMWIPNDGTPEKRELQLEVYEEGCDGERSVETVSHTELLAWLNGRRHVLYKTNDEDAPNAIKDSNGEVVLAMCRRCKKAEVDLDMSTPCISERELALREAATIARGGLYNGDYYSNSTDRQDDVCRWLEKRILELAEKEVVKIDAV